MRWKDLREREKGRKVYIVGTGPSCERVLGHHAKICMNFAPVAHAADYWIRGDGHRHFDDDQAERFKATVAAARRAGAVCLAGDEPLEGDIPFRWAYSPEYQSRTPYELLECEDLPGFPIDCGTLGGALALVAWLRPSEVELVGCDFGPVDGKLHYYDARASSVEALSTALAYSERFRWMYCQVIKHHKPALEALGIRFVCPVPLWMAEVQAKAAKAESDRAARVARSAATSGDSRAVGA